MASTAEKLAETVPSRGISLAYGDKVTVDGAEMIPVAVVSYGFGAGDFDSRDDDHAAMPKGTGGGGGGGGMAVPIGAYVGGADGLRFRPNLIALLAVSIPVICTAGWAIAKIVKAAR